MTQFRVTLWFKRGELDAPDPDDDAPTDRERPVEDRYRDDGSVTGSDVVAYSVRTGDTQHVPLCDALGEAPSESAGDVACLVGDLQRGRGAVMAAIGGALALACAVVILHAL
jgi:hypothetical protein